MIPPIGIITILLGGWVLLAGVDAAVAIFVPFTLLGSAGAILIGTTGTIQPAHLLLGSLAALVLLRPENLTVVMRSLAFPREGFWLVLATAFGVLGATLVPRILAGATLVNAIGVSDYGPTFFLVPLGPTSGNYTQSIYLLADAVCFLTMLAYADRLENYLKLGRLLLAYAVFNIVFAALDMVTFWTGTTWLLSFIRNANYSFHLEEVAGGLKRIAGSFTETSAFSFATLGSFGFTIQLWCSGFQPRLTLALSLTSLALLILSTSSTALVATPLLLVLIYGSTFLRALHRRGSRAQVILLVTAPLIVIVALGVLAFDRPLQTTVVDYLNLTVFNKGDSDSGRARAEWNAAAMQNFIDTWGVGGGLGSIRASSFVLAVMSNLGVVGMIGFAGLFLNIFLSRRRSPAAEVLAMRAGARTACVGLLIAASLSGSLVDLGLPFYVFAALACAEPRAAAARSMAAASLPLRRAPGYLASARPITTQAVVR